jgi:predicted amidohydrolase YtcJ
MRFVKLGVEAARLGLRVNCVISRDIEYGLSVYEAIEVSIRDRRQVMIHVNQATDGQIRRMRDLGVIATVVPGFLWMAGDRYADGSAGELFTHDSGYRPRLHGARPGQLCKWSDLCNFNASQSHRSDNVRSRRSGGEDFLVVCCRQSDYWGWLRPLRTEPRHAEQEVVRVLPWG